MSSRIPLRTALLASLLLAGPSQALRLLPGDVVVADLGTRSILRIDPATGAQEVVAADSGLVAPVAVAVAPGGSALYVSDVGVPGDGDGVILRIDPATGARTLVASIEAGDLELDASGRLIVSELFGPAVYALEPQSEPTLLYPTGAIDPVEVPIESADALGLGDAGRIAVIFNPRGLFEIAVTPPSDASLVALQDRCLASGCWRDVVESATGTWLLLESDLGGSRLLEVGPDSDPLELFSIDGELADLALATDGGVLLLDAATARVLRADLASGTSRIVSQGGLLETPVSLALVPVPEPGTLLLLGAGALALGVGRRPVRAIRSGTPSPGGRPGSPPRR